jgi:phage tail-like protein
MTQAIHSPKLKVFLDPQQPLEVVTPASFSFETPQNPIAKGLILQPGKTGKIALTISNLEKKPLLWRLKIEGDLPKNTIVSWDNSNFPEIPPNKSLDTNIYFQVPQDFFEQQDILNNEKKILDINYQIEITIYATSKTLKSLSFLNFWYKWSKQIEIRYLYTWFLSLVYQLNYHILQHPQGYKFFDIFIRPNTSYLDFLPAIYKQVDFFGRFVSLFEQAFDPVVLTSDTFWAYLDPLTAPSALLPFLAHWVGWELDPRWSLEAQRRLIRNAVELYRWHGTKYGLHTYLHLYTGLPKENISIQEDFNQGFLLGETKLGQDSVLGGGRPYHFIVELYPEQPNQIDEHLVREVIEEQKPAFSTYELRLL